MATLVDPDFRARLGALNDKYAAAVPGLMASIELVLQQCEAAGPDGPATPQLTALHKSLHTVAGSAATFGFPVLGQQCRLLEQQLRLLTAQPDGADAVRSAWPALSRQTRQLLAWAAVDAKAATYVPAPLP